MKERIPRKKKKEIFKFKDRQFEKKCSKNSPRFINELRLTYHRIKTGQYGEVKVTPYNPL